MTVLLIATHLLAYIAGGITVRYLLLRFVRIREIEGHPALELSGRPHEGDPVMHKPLTRGAGVGLILLVAALLLVGIGVQAQLAADDNRQRDARDRAYAVCMTRFAADLVDSLDRRTKASIRLEAAERRKDRALDALLSLTLAARNTGAKSEAQLPRQLVRRYEAVLRERVEAQRAYQRVYRDVLEVRRQNQYVRPQVVCSR